MKLICLALQVVFRDPVRYKQQKCLTVAAEGVYSGQVHGEKPWALVALISGSSCSCNRSCCAGSCCKDPVRLC